MKNKKILTLFIIVVVILTGNSGYCQISRGGVPQSFSRTGLSDSVLIASMPAVNVDSLLAEDTMEEDKAMPFRFGYAIDVDLGLQNSGRWETLSDGDKIWRLKIYSEGAFSINLIFDEFWLPEGAQFFVYNEDHSMILGAFTSDVSNNEYSKFATDLVKGNMLVLEYYEPAYTSGGIINIDKVIHGYKNMFKSDGLGQSGSCNIDVNCSQGNDWCVEKRAVSMILVDDNTAFCTGCLINNARQDLTPYYLTANHCLRGSQSTWIFRFKYWRPTCGGPDPGHWVSIAGSTIRANHAASDFALLELFAQPPSGFGVLYAGWDRTSVAPPSAVGIHHPSGDVMKISLENNSPISSDYEPSPISPNSHWKVIWNNGTTEGGSSGSPLFNNNHRIIGQLHGGWASCSSPSSADYYGRFDVSWTGGGTSSTRLRNWLDPDNTGATTVGATSPTIYLINRTLTGTYKFAALTKIHIEGNIATIGSFCQPSNVPFTAEPGSNVTIKAKTITIYPGTEFKAGSEISVIATDGIECSDNIVEGDYVNVFCDAQISMQMNSRNSYASNSENINPSNKEQKIVNLSNNITLFPNPAKSEFSVSYTLDKNDFVKLELYTVHGLKIKSLLNVNNQAAGNYYFNFSVSELSTGIYVLVFTSSTKKYTYKLIKN